jgi:hypothetical protein
MDSLPLRINVPVASVWQVTPTALVLLYVLPPHPFSVVLTGPVLPALFHARALMGTPAAGCNLVLKIYLFSPPFYLPLSDKYHNYSGTINCVSLSTVCPTIPNCPVSAPVACPNGGGCRATSEDCPSTLVCSPGTLLCPDGVSCAFNTTFCPVPSVCFGSQVYFVVLLEK